MKINEDFMLRNIAGEYIIVATGESSKDFNGMISVNEVAAFIWDNINSSKDEEEIVKKVLDEFDVNEHTARVDVYGFISELIKVGMII